MKLVYWSYVRPGHVVKKDVPTLASVRMTSCGAVRPNRALPALLGRLICLGLKR